MSPQKGVFQCFFVRASKIVLNNWVELTNSESDTHYERKSSLLSTFFEKIDQSLNYRWYARARYYLAHADHLDLLKLKNQFTIDPRHLRKVWDLGTRIFDEANPILPGIFLLEPCFHLFKKNSRSKNDHRNYTRKIWILLVEGFPTVIFESSQPFWSVGKLIFLSARIGHPIQLYEQDYCYSTTTEIRTPCVPKILLPDYRGVRVSGVTIY